MVCRWPDSMICPEKANNSTVESRLSVSNDEIVPKSLFVVCGSNQSKFPLIAFVLFMLAI